MEKKYLFQIPVIISLIGCLFLIIGNFIPFVKMSSTALDYARDFNFGTYEGKYIVFVAILAIILILLEEPKYAGIPLLVATILLCYVIFNKTSIYDDCVFYESMFSWGPGLYIMIIGNLMSYTLPVIELVKLKYSIKLKK